MTNLDFNFQDLLSRSLQFREFSRPLSHEEIVFLFRFRVS